MNSSGKLEIMDKQQSDKLLALVGRDNEGFLLDTGDWSEALAFEIADELTIELTGDHWFVVLFVRDWYEMYQSVPEARKLLKAMKAELGVEKSTRRYLYQLFPYGYGQQACMIAGMRKPLKLMLDL